VELRREADLPAPRRAADHPRGDAGRHRAAAQAARSGRRNRGCFGRGRPRSSPRRRVRCPRQRQRRQRRRRFGGRVGERPRGLTAAGRVLRRRAFAAVRGRRPPRRPLLNSCRAGTRAAAPRRRGRRPRPVGLRRRPRRRRRPRPRCVGVPPRAHAAVGSGPARRRVAPRPRSGQPCRTRGRGGAGQRRVCERGGVGRSAARRVSVRGHGGRPSGRREQARAARSSWGRRKRHRRRKPRCRRTKATGALSAAAAAAVLGPRAAARRPRSAAHPTGARARRQRRQRRRRERASVDQGGGERLWRGVGRRSRRQRSRRQQPLERTQQRHPEFAAGDGARAHSTLSRRVGFTGLCSGGSPRGRCAARAGQLARRVVGPGAGGLRVGPRAARSGVAGALGCAAAARLVAALGAARRLSPPTFVVLKIAQHY
jgi:hypothetical protein